ncbi:MULTISPECIES: BON domain-containing protein [unclassified Imperialibacter]|uniref:BON domain-containing protein n=1 Tax=unclassified Imperialibacter TaxID=2629706 RepID=UPI001250D729|nr:MULTISPECIES: BON domain-containing protein [unclassified Imperialibacter]CAD5265571.1 BON domain-containing protein [Imperialibacter sp. 89]CAD5270392.1 BON domain-containing protein [Imperialibacter sp. 75]VVT10037.1 Osmotically inducible protein Y [Imperialibacter sp. EC-SDR9]
MKTNEELQKDVMEELKWDPLLRDVASQIGVTANEGVVTLSGLVDTYSKKLAAERAAQRVTGVNVVAVDLEVKIEAMHVKTDIEIADAINNALKWHSALKNEQIEVKVDNGWVYLTGFTYWDYERRATANAVRNLIGVKGVTNNIMLKSQTIDPKQIKGKIAAAFHRSATVDSSNLHVNVSGNHVTLSGKVRSWAEKREAEKVAWSSPGVTRVDNEIEIDTSVLVA